MCAFRENWARRIALACLSPSRFETLARIGRRILPPSPGDIVGVGYETLIQVLESRKLCHVAGDLIEIGAFVGRGTRKLALWAAAHGKLVFAVDVFEPGSDQTRNTDGVSMAQLYKIDLRGEDMFCAFQKNIHDLGNVHVCKADSATLAFPPQVEFCFGFVDGNHDPYYVQNDFRLVWGNLSSGGVLGFHDYRGDLPQTTAAIERVIEGARSELIDVFCFPDKWLVFLQKR